jgi:uncharacterized protein (DUF362 family)
MESEHAIYFERRAVYSYPSPAPFHPGAAYPEYPWPGSLASEENHAYDMVRHALYGLGMDAKNYGTPRWNPLGEVIREGDTVLLKPNMVLHENVIRRNGTDCLITHPSVVRAVADYAAIALKGSGRIVIGDAPIQTCDFETLVREQGYLELVSFYRQQGLAVSLHDFRLFKSVLRAGLVVNKLNDHDQMANYTVVDLGEGSEFHGMAEERYRKLRVTNYDPDRMLEHHNSRKNEYLVPNIILAADVVINMPKPKTHKKAGVTIALKNLVGITGHKDWLPHHSQGSLSEKGDEYPHRSWLKGTKVLLQEQIDKASIAGKYPLAVGLKGAQAGFRLLDKLLSKDGVNDGNWFGNDTIWRTIIDLNKVLLYADKQGVLQDTPQRRVMVVGDMIVSGEKEGPLLPSPKEVGVIGVGTDFVTFDAACATLMGFQVGKIPSVANAGKLARYPLAPPGESSRVIRSNDHFWDNKRPEEIHKECTLGYAPSKGWLGHIEL